MNVKELHDKITAALERGLDPKTTVVFDCTRLYDNYGEWAVVNSIECPTQRGDGGLIWFTLGSESTSHEPVEWADLQLHLGHEVDT